MSERFYTAQDTEPIQRLREAFGDEVILSDQGEDTAYRILREFRIGEHEYAVLRSQLSRDPEEYLIFRIGQDAGGTLELETIEDDEEWEAVAEVYDEMTFEP